MSQVGGAEVSMKNPQFWHLDHRTKSLARAIETSSLHGLWVSCLGNGFRFLRLQRVQAKSTNE